MTKHDMLLCVSRVEGRSEDRCSQRVRKTGEKHGMRKKEKEGERGRSKSN
jgi:hypothetical protein